MIPFKLPDAASSVLAIGITAVDLQTAIRTASGTKFMLPERIDAVTIFVESGAIRWLDEGNTPTDTNGHMAAASLGTHVISLEGLAAKKFKMISAGLNDATVTIRIGITS